MKIFLLRLMWKRILKALYFYKATKRRKHGLSIYPRHHILKKKFSSTTKNGFGTTCKLSHNGERQNLEFARTDCALKVTLVSQYFFPFLRGTQRNAIHFKVRHETVIFMNIRKKAVFSLSLKFSELIKNFFWHEPSLPWLYFPSPNIFCSSDTVSLVEKISQLYCKLSTCSTLQVPS